MRFDVKLTILILVTYMATSTVMYGQSQTDDNAKIQAKIIALENEAWTAWKNNNPSWVKANAVEGLLSVNADGVSTKAEVMASIPVDCKVKSFSLDEFTFRMLNKKVALLTYVARAEGMCGDEKIPAKARAAVTYVKENGKWMEAFYMDMAITE